MSSVRRRVAIMDWCASRNAVSVIPTRGFFLRFGGFFHFLHGNGRSFRRRGLFCLYGFRGGYLVAITFPLASLISCFTPLFLTWMTYPSIIKSNPQDLRERGASGVRLERRCGVSRRGSLGYCILLRLAGFIQVVMSFFFVNYLQFRKILKNLYGGSIQFVPAVRPRRQKRSPRNGGLFAVFLSLSD